MHSAQWDIKKNPKLITKLIKIFRNCKMALKGIQLEIRMMRIKTEKVVEKKIKKFLKSYKFLI